MFHNKKSDHVPNIALHAMLIFVIDDMKNTAFHKLYFCLPCITKIGHACQGFSSLPPPVIDVSIKAFRTCAQQAYNLSNGKLVILHSIVSYVITYPCLWFRNAFLYSLELKKTIDIAISLWQTWWYWDKLLSFLWKWIVSHFILKHLWTKIIRSNLFVNILPVVADVI